MRALRAVRAVFLALLIAAVPAGSFAAIAVSITVAPPLLPVYTPPPCPANGYLWQPGYWAWGPAGYYWVPGVWGAPPAVGLLWTPGYWGFAGGIYLWHAGYWGPHVGFYGGVNYGFGYFGTGFVGGRWVGGRFAYNTAVVTVNRAVVRNTYIDRTVIRNNVANRTSFNGPGGINARATAQQQAAFRERRSGPTSSQLSHQRVAGQNRANFASVNRGRPATPAMSRTENASRPAYHSGGTRPANRAEYNGARPGNAQSRPNERPAPQARPQNGGNRGGGAENRKQSGGNREPH